MITLKQKQTIILKHLDGLSNRQIAADMHMSKDTVNKYVNEYSLKRQALLALDPSMDNSEIIQTFIEAPSYNASNRKSIRITSKLMSAVEECLALNSQKRERGMHKQQMKKIDIHAYLKAQGFDISYSTVKRIVKSMDDRKKEAFIRQEYSPGDICEFDWGTVKLNIDDTGYYNYQLAVFTTAFSNYRFAYLFRSQDTVAFQESHALFFDHCKGVFHTMVYDNMKVAVKKFVGLYEKEPTKALTELSVYYGFGFRFCNIAKGNEKGHVERSVEFIRRKVFSAPGNDCFASLSDANAFLLEGCLRLNDALISNRTVPSKELDKEKVLLLSAVPLFESCRKVTGIVDKYSTIVVYQNHYSVPDIFVGKQLDIRIYSHRIVVYNDRNIIATHERSFKLRDWRIDIYHYLRTLKRKKGALPQSTALLQADTKIKNIYNRYYNADAHMFLEILEIIKEQGVDAVEKALHRLELLSPLDMSSDKVRVLCDTHKDLWSPGTDSISEKAKSTLAKYDQLRVLQTQINLRDKVVAL